MGIGHAVQFLLDRVFCSACKGFRYYLFGNARFDLFDYLAGNGRFEYTWIDLRDYLVGNYLFDYLFGRFNGDNRRCKSKIGCV